VSITTEAFRGVRKSSRWPVVRASTRPRNALVERRLDQASTAARPSTATRLLAACGVFLTALGLVIAVFFAYLFGLSAIQSARGQHQLLAEFSGPAGLAAISGRAPGEGQPAAVLTIPALHLQQVVVEGTSAADLQSGPGLMPGTAAPGTFGDAVIAGRRTTFGGAFAAISSLRPGSVVSITTARGIYHYIVTGVVAMPNSAPLPVGQHASAQLFLVTSRSSFPPSGWLVVRAKLHGHPLPSAEVSSGIPTQSELHLSGDVSAALPSLLWGEALAALIVVAVVAYRRSRQPLVTYLLTMPILFVVALLCFQNIARLLPATM